MASTLVNRQVLRKTQPKATTAAQNQQQQQQQQQQARNAPKLEEKKPPCPILKKVSSFDTVVELLASPEKERGADESNGCIDYESPLRQDGLIMDPPTPLFFSFTYGLYADNRHSTKINNNNSNSNSNNNKVMDNGLCLPDEESSSNCSSCTVEDPSPPPRKAVVATTKKKRVTFAVPEAVPFTMKKVPCALSFSTAPAGSYGRKPPSSHHPSFSSSKPKVVLQHSSHTTFMKKQTCPKPGRIAPDVAMDAHDETGVKKRCAWITAQSDAAYIEYHDTEWGVPVHDDRKLFELLVFSGAQAELSWSAILHKREHYRSVFCGFDPELVSKFDEDKIASLAADPEISQHDGKLRQIVDNAKCILEVAQEFGSFDKFIWNFVGYKAMVNRHRTPQQVPIKSAKSDYVSRDLMKRGFRFVGPTIVYSFMQAAGLINDHLTCCFRHGECTTAAAAAGGTTKAISSAMTTTTAATMTTMITSNSNDEQQQQHEDNSSSSSRNIRSNNNADSNGSSDSCC